MTDRSLPMPVREEPTTLELQMGYMQAVERLERVAAEAVALTMELERNDIPDDLELADTRRRWLIELHQSRELCRRHRRRNTVVDRILRNALRRMRVIRGGAS